VLTLAEELFLLSINDEKGVIQKSAAQNLRYGLAAAMLSELILEGRLGMEDGHIVVLEEIPTFDELLNETLFKVTHENRPRKPSHWINALSRNYDLLENRLASALVMMGILQKEGKRLLWIIPYDVYPQRDASAKYWIKQRLRDAILTEAQPEKRTVALLSLLHALKMLNLIFTKDERKAARQRVDELVKDDVFGQSVAEAIQSIDMAAAHALLAATSN
jgi:hypothetical protein